MPVIASHLTTGSDASDLDSYATASISPGSNRLVLAAILNRETPGVAVLPTISGNGLTWVQVATKLFEPINLAQRITLFRAMGSSPSSGVVTIDFGGNAQVGCAWSVTEFANVDTSGADGAGAIQQSAVNEDDPVTSLTVTLAAFDSVDNATYGAVGVNVDDVPLAGSGFSLLGNTSHDDGATDIGIGSEWRNDNDTSVDMTWTDSAESGGIAVEIVFSPPLVGGPLYY